MAITGIDTIEGKQIIAAGAVSAKSAEMAYNDENGNPITGYQVAGDYYSASNPSGFISEVPDTYLQNTDLTISDGKITEISGIPLSAGGDVPEGVMVESGLEYNAVNEISAYNGSAIAQYGAEKQWLVHDDTLVHLSNSAQYALGCNISAVAQLLGVDETVLWAPDNVPSSGNNGTSSLNENVSAFTKLDFYYFQGSPSRRNYGIHRTEISGTSAECIIGPWCENNTNANWFRLHCKVNGTNATFDSFFNGQAGLNVLPTASGGHMWSQGNIYKIVGIGRKEV